MSQAGILNIESGNLPPTVPEQFNTNSGGPAIPAANQLNIFAEYVGAAGIPIQTVGFGDTVEVESQLTSASASSSALNAGLASFNSADFVVDSNGYVTLSGSASAITFDADVGSATPLLNIINFKGTSSQGISSSASGNTVTYTIADATSTQLGVASFNATEFTVTSGNVTSNNFTITAGSGLSGGGSLTLGGSVTLSAGGTIATTYTANTGSATPSGNNLDILGNYISAGSGDPVITTASGSTVIVNVQLSEATGSSSANNAGIASFSSSDFAVDANGFVTLAGTGGAPIQTITGNTGGAEVPSAGNFNILGTGSITIAGSANTETVQLTGLTNHAVLIGAGTATITKVGPTSTSGQVLQSQGSSSDPAFSTATYPSTTTINQILYSSSANVVAGLATANDGVLTTGTTGIPVITALASDGQLIIGSSAGAPAAATLTAGTGISITNGHNSISIAVNGSVVGETITGNSGGALSPTAGNWNILGAGSITTAGSGSTLTVELQNLTQYNILLGQGTTTIGLLAPSTAGQLLTSAGASSNPTWTTSTYPGTNAVNTLLYASSANVMAALATADNGVLITSASGVPSWLADGTTGQVLTATTGSPPSWENVAASSVTFTGDSGTPFTGNAVTVTGGTTGLTFAASSPDLTLGGKLIIANGGTDSSSFNINGVVISAGTTTGALTSLTLTNGQVVIGSTGAAPAAATLTAGAGITITNAANSITIAANEFAFAYTNVNHAASPYTVLSTDQYISVDCSAGVVTLKFPNAPTANRTWVVKDRTGNASLYNISLTTVGGSVTIDGQTTYTMVSNYSAVSILANSTPTYEIY